MKPLLMKHGPKLMFVAVLALSAGFAYLNYENAPEELETKQVPKRITEINQLLERKKVSPAYPYNAEHAAKLKEYSIQAKANVERPSHTTDEPTGANETYPLPTRPKSQIFVAGAITEVYAVMVNPKNVECKPDQGILYISFKIPEDKELKDMKLVRAEIFRGKDDPKNIDTSKPYGQIVFGPEVEPPAPPPGTVATPTVAPAPEPEGRRPHATPNAKKGPVKPAIPEAMRMVRVFKDSMVDQQVTYFYQVRLVGRMTKVDGDINITEKAPDGTALKSFRFHAPNENDPLPAVAPSAANSTAKLYATKLSPVVSATAPTNYKFRLSAIKGELPVPGQPRNPANPLIKTYSGSFEVSVWIKEAQDWKRAIVDAQEGDMLGGTVKYSANGENKSFNFTDDFGYKLLHIEMEPDEDSKIKPTPLIETATVLNMRTKKEEKYPKAPNLKEREKSLAQLDEIYKQQEEQKKLTTEKVKAAIERIKTEGEQRREKMRQDAEAAQPPTK